RLEAGETVAARASLDQLDELAHQLRQPLQLWTVTWLRTMDVTAAGDFVTAERLAHEAFEIGEQAEDPDALSIFGVQLGFLRLEQSRAAEIAPLMRQFLAEYDDVPAYRAGWCLLLAVIGKHDEARVELETFASTGFATLRSDFVRLAALGMLAQASSLLDTP